MEVKESRNNPNDSNEKTNPNRGRERDEEQASENRSTTDERPLVSTSPQGH